MDANTPKSGKYVVAVSGGVDSVALLHFLASDSRSSTLDLIVAHLDHGMRADSAEDRRFVEALAVRYDLPYIYEEAELGAGANEAEARDARYAFLRRVMEENRADAIITAHHQDDVLETAVINLLRGTNRKGLSSLRERPGLLRPFLNLSKQEVLEYATKEGLEWREDETNQDESYLRNYVRHRVLPRLDMAQKERLRNIIRDAESTNIELDNILEAVIGTESNDIDRQWFNALPHAAAKEVMAAWLRRNGVRDFDSPGLERAVIAAKTGKNNTKFTFNRTVKLEIGTTRLALVGSER